MFLRTLLLGAALTLAASFNVFAADTWRIVEVSGSAMSGAGGVMPSAPTPSTTMAKGVWVETGADGRVTIVRGADEIRLQPLSRIMIFEAKVAGDPSILHSLGDVEYAAGGPALVVGTPFLTAEPLQKAKFKVHIEDTRASVAVTTGSVKVISGDGSVEMPVAAGSVASTTPSGGIVIDKR